MYTLATDNNGYGQVFYDTPCGARVPIAQIWYDIRNDQNGLEPPIVSFNEKSNTVKMVNEVMFLVNEHVKGELNELSDN